MKLIKIEQLKGQIELITGLHIGAGDTEMHIGGTDSPVAKHPQTLQPYIPGSSLKGKIRSLLELSSGLMLATKGKPLSWADYEKSQEAEKEEARKILELFGGAAQNDKFPEGINPITRLSFSDCFVSRESVDHILTEVKSENTIDRSTSTAANPRFIERVPQGIKFDFCLSVKVFDGDNEKEILDEIMKGMKLLEMDALGGSGSRGYGRIKFIGLNIDGKNLDQYCKELK